jgi:predicted nucleic acid-binding protein
MIGSYLVDTNILVYAYDRSEPRKAALAADLLTFLAVSGQGMLLLQVLAEFFVTVTRKIARPFPFDPSCEAEMSRLKG